MTALQIPDPPAGGPWVERYRDVNRFTGERFIFYESEADDCYSRTVELTLRSDGRRKYFEWSQVYEIAGNRANVPEWQRGGYEPAPDLAFEPPPVTAPVARAGPEEHSSREERRSYEKRKEEPEPDPVPVPDVPLEPAPGTLYDGVPAEERRAFTRWLNG